MMRSQLALLMPALLCVARVSANPSPPPPSAFVGVTVIPMDRERVLLDQTVVIREGKIAALGRSAEVAVPADALRIDARGKYLIPGLMDMHTHLFSDEDLPDELAGDELAVMVANGVTTIRLMIGTPEHLALRRKIAAGEMLGPTLYVASPQLAGRATGHVFNGRVVREPAEAQRAVRDFKAAGYDFIKLTTDISLPVYDAVIAEAKAQGIRVVGHVDPRVGVRHALASGQHIEHLDCYMEDALRDDAPSRQSVSDYGVWRKPNWATLDFVVESKVAQLAKVTAESGTYTCPTLTFFELCFAIEQSDEQIKSRPDFRFFPRQRREPLLAAHRRFWTEPPSADRRAMYLKTRDALVKQIHDAGGKIMAGSDSPELFLLYGYTLHRELQNLVDAGMTPYQALAAATRVPSEFLRGEGLFGTVEVGKRADLVLLDADPLSAIDNTQRRAGVMIGGRWIPAKECEQMLETIAARFDGRE